MSSRHSKSSVSANGKVVASIISYKFGKTTHRMKVTKKRHFRIWWRTNSGTRVQSPKEEKSAELNKSGPLETPKGEFKRLGKGPVLSRNETAPDRMMGLAPIEELSFDEEVLDNRDENSKPFRKGGFLGQRLLLCGCL